MRAGRYEIEGEIARGGMGAVWCARDPDLGRTLAVKVLREDYRGRPDMDLRFREEAQITGQLQHPGIPPVHEVSTLADGRPFFAMKFIRGRSLADLLEERASSADDLPRFLGIFEQVCQTLAYAHSMRVIHRDVKPSNVMVGAFGEVQVMDWGLAKVLTGARPAAGPRAAEASAIATVRTEHAGLSSQAGDVLGTPAFMAPEQARGEVDQLDERCDVFGLGAVLCILLTGLPLYRGDSRGEVLARAAQGDLDDALARLDASGADGELIRLARRCLAPEKGDRPRDAGEVARSLGAYLAGVQERLREAERQRAAAEARARAERRARQLLLGLVAAVLLLGLAGGGGAWLLQRQRAEAQARQRQTDQEVLPVVRRGRGLLEAGWQANDLAKLREAKAEADRAADMARSGAASAAVQEKSGAFREEAGRRLGQAERNRALLDALLDVLVPPEIGTYGPGASGMMMALPPPSPDEQYAAAFRRWGLDVDAAAEGEALARLREQPEPVLQEIIAGLDSWMLERRRANRPEGEWRYLYRLAGRLDRSDLRRQLRALLAEESPPRAEAVAGLLGGAPPWTALWELGRGGPWLRSLTLRGQVHVETEPVLTVLLLVQACAVAGDVAGAEQVLRQAVAARPDQVVLVKALGNLLNRQGPSRLPEAIGCYRAARALRPQLGSLLADALGRAGQKAEEEAVLRDLVRLQPDNPERHAYLGVALHEQQKLDGAVAAYRRAVELKRDYANGYNALAVALHQQDRLDEAVLAYCQAIQLKPDLAVAHVGLGYALMQQGRFVEGVTALKRSLELLPADKPLRAAVLVAVRRRQRLADLDARLPAVLRGADQPTSAAERLEFAGLCRIKRLYAASARFRRDALAAEPGRGDDLSASARYQAARVAALAGCGQGKDAGTLDDRERAGWRQQAHDWLRADLAAWGKVPAGARLEQALRQWQADADLARVRDPDALAKLPEAERRQWQQLWADVADLLARVR
jgi:serine/threonine-protein kinase